MARLRLRFVVISVACGLILAASGDDFCLPRVAAPSLLAKARAVSTLLDDPNTDFTMSDDFAPGVWQPGALPPPAPVLVPPLVSSPPSPATAAPPARLRAPVATPLLC